MIFNVMGEIEKDCCSSEPKNEVVKTIIINVSKGGKGYDENGKFWGYFEQLEDGTILMSGSPFNLTPGENKNNKQEGVNGVLPLDEKAISRAKRRFDFWCGCMVWYHPKKYSYFKVCSVCDRRQTDR